MRLHKQGGLMKLGHNFGLTLAEGATHVANSGETNSLAPRRESGFADGRNEVSPDSEQIEHVIAEQFMRNSVSVEQIQDRVSEGRVRGPILIRSRNKLVAVAINGYASAFTLCSGFAMTVSPHVGRASRAQ